MANMFYNNGKLVCETVEAESVLRFFSQSRLGRFFSFLAKSRIISWLYGFFARSFLSRYKIKPFVKKYAIKMNDFVTPPGGFSSFNDFFIRALRPGARIIDRGEDVLVSPADSKLLVIPRITKETRFFVKSKPFCLKRFLDDESLAKQYEQGTLLLFRLAPYDYHRYHVPCDGVPSKHRVIPGALESVHPIMYKTGSLPLQTNERHLTLLETKKFGSVAVVAVGAQLVGSISHVYIPGEACRKGDESGYFSFGGSSLVLLFKRDSIVVDREFLEHSQENFETAVRVGQRIGEKK